MTIPALLGAYSGPTCPLSGGLNYSSVPSSGGPLIQHPQVVSSVLPGPVHGPGMPVIHKHPSRSHNYPLAQIAAFPSYSRNKAVGRSCYRSIWKWEPIATLAPGTKSSKGQKQKHVCPNGLVTIVTSRVGSPELQRMLLAPASPGTGTSLMPGKLTFPRWVVVGDVGLQLVPQPLALLPSPA